MITVTERAVAGIEELLVAHEAPTNEGVKLVRAPSGGVGITIGAPAEGDEVVLEGDRPRLIVDRRIAPSLDGAVLDVDDPDGTGGEPRFTLTKARAGGS